MRAIFKEKTKLIVNSADSTEQLLLGSFIENANSGNYNFMFNNLLDINGDVTGMAIELVKKVEEEPAEDEPVEDTDDTNNTDNTVDE